jgi:hypothetical protein
MKLLRFADFLAKRKILWQWVKQVIQTAQLVYQLKVL